jgi:sec-independent protein translocase protein TatC
VSDPQTQDPVEEHKMPLMEHLVELRRRLIYSISAFLICFLAAYHFAQPLFEFLVEPLRLVQESQPGAHRLIFTAPTEAFFTYVKVAFFAAAFIAFPVIASQIWLFVAPGLYKHEKSAFLPFLIATPVMFLLGAGLLYYFILPMALKFFTSFEVPAGDGVMAITLEAKMSEYLSLVMTLILAFGISFQLPVLLSLLVRVGILS